MAFGVLHLSDIHFRENETEIQEGTEGIASAETRTRRWLASYGHDLQHT